MGLATPVKYQSVSAMERKIEKYFVERANHKVEIYNAKKGEVVDKKSVIEVKLKDPGT